MGLGILRSLNTLAADPHGPLGWVTAWIMPPLSDTYCGNMARLLDIRPEDDVLEQKWVCPTGPNVRSVRC